MLLGTAIGTCSIEQVHRSASDRERDQESNSSKDLSHMSKVVRREIPILVSILFTYRQLQRRLEARAKSTPPGPRDRNFLFRR